MIHWPNELIDDIARRKCVLYLGSGVSANSRGADGKTPPTWGDFLKYILEKRANELEREESTIRDLIERREYLTACEVIVDRLTERDFGELAADEFRRPGYQPSRIHEIIFGLDSKLVITPNIDKIYDQCAITSSHGTVIVKKYNEDIAPFLRQPDYLVIKAHGCVDDPQHIVFTHKQYNNARYRYASFYRILETLMLTNTFVFIGCGLSDPDIQLTLENCNFSYPNCKPHYFITARGSVPDEVAKSIHYNRNITFLTYDNPDGSHAQLIDELEILGPLVEEKRREIASSATW